MSPIRAGSALAATAVSPQALTEAADALGFAVERGGEQLPVEPRRRANAVVAKTTGRMSIVGGHTVVALAGATGSGKSSLMNALVGTNLVTVGARRPTTSSPTAAIWGAESAGELLEWLGVPQRHHVEGRGPGEFHGSLDGLVVLDLPDFDSRETAHRVEAERVLELVDVFVWVTDPQKYADARLHDDYVATLSAHEAVTIAVLNQVDRLTPEQTQQCAADLKRLLARDGVPGAAVLTTSTKTGAGLDELRQRLANAVAGGSAARTRLAADVRSCADTLLPSVGSTEPALNATAERELVDALARSAGVPTVVDAVSRDYRRGAAARTGWPFTRWVHSLRPEPLRRLRLDGDEVKVSEADVRSVLGRSSLPPPTPAARAAVSLATRRVADRAGGALPTPWADAVEDAATPAGNDLADALDQAVLATSLRTRDPLWWRFMSWLQLLLAAGVVVGLLWYVLILGLSWFQFDPLPLPKVGPVPVPFLLVAGGLLLGVVLAALAAALASWGSKRRARAVDERLRTSISVVADRQILAPVVAVLERHRDTRDALGRARGA